MPVPHSADRTSAPPAPHQAWSADITDVWTGKGAVLVIAGALADCVHLIRMRRLSVEVPRVLQEPLCSFDSPAPACDFHPVAEAADTVVTTRCTLTLPCGRLFSGLQRIALRLISA